MRYEEEPRAYNVFSGLALGLALGASVALLLSLDRRPTAAERLRHGARSVGEGAGRRAKRWSDAASDGISRVVAGVR
jgi:hypothetical protein